MDSKGQADCSTSARSELERLNRIGFCCRSTGSSMTYAKPLANARGSVKHATHATEPRLVARPLGSGWAVLPAGHPRCPSYFAWTAIIVASMARYSPLLLLALATTCLCLAAENNFARGLYPVLQKANCRACHVDGGIASATRLHFPELNASSEDVEAFGKSLTTLVNRDRPETSSLYTKPTNREKHTGGKLILPGSPQEALLLDWVRYLAQAAPPQPTSNIQHPTSVPMRRLTHSQYNHTVRDLLGDQTSPANQFLLRISSMASRTRLTRRVFPRCSRRLIRRPLKSWRATRFAVAIPTG